MAPNSRVRHSAGRRARCPLRRGKPAWIAALSALACVLFVYFVGVMSKRSLAGLLAAFILASSLHFTWLARVGRIDMPLTCMVATTLVCFARAEQDDLSRLRRLGLLLTAYVCLAAAVLLKGPIGIVLPVAEICATRSRNVSKYCASARRVMPRPERGRVRRARPCPRASS